MASFLARGGSAAINPAPFWSDTAAPAEVKAAATPLKLGASGGSLGASGGSGGGGGGAGGSPPKPIRPAGVPGAFDERSQASVGAKRAVATIADALAARYEAAKGDRPAIVPGYTGYIPHAREIAGRSQTRTAARALTHPAEELALKDSLPSDPVHKAAIMRLHHEHALTELGKDMTSTLIGRNESLPKHVPGYTGHVPGIKDCTLGLSYGAITAGTLKGAAMDAKAGRRALIEAGSTVEARGTTPGFPYVRPRPKPLLVCDDPSLYLHYTGK